ncbi:LLM class flavin-dependent oxidoreductase [Paenibacillus glucanolyticus]|uniref:LLM class flavin-dependent oxidoreductase n=1 Tax=Paenibacillus glucanolyticus TaxID=59843 RepID=UPI00096DA731|nr:LLM class flavin-dependent oxidoreductase [Paenibacillus glucanolyticus]OMF69650.1 luciferase [Paenibacillus glucanolyticus]
MENYRIDPSKGIEFGLYSLGEHTPNPHTGERISAEQRIHELIEAAKLAEQAGIDVFGIGESHQDYFISQAHTVILGAIAQATEKIKITSSASIISTSDPVRVYEDFATIDLISRGRTELVAGRASRVGLFNLLGYDLRDYEELYEEKFELLNMINEQEQVTWSGQFRASLVDAAILPRPQRGNLPIWRAVGGASASAIKAGIAGVPMMLATLAGPSVNFKGAVDAYRKSAKLNGFDPKTLPIGTTSLFYAAETRQQAMSEFYPHVNSGLQLANGRGFPKQQFAQAADKRDALMVGSPQEIIEKILYQHELFGHQRYLAQLDFGGVPFDKVAKNIELIGTEILPAIKKYTAK